ncbi:MAG: hypothetical protein ACX94B_10480 [Henriciella sp.]
MPDGAARFLRTLPAFMSRSDGLRQAIPMSDRPFPIGAVPQTRPMPDKSCSPIRSRITLWMQPGSEKLVSRARNIFAKLGLSRAVSDLRSTPSSSLTSLMQVAEPNFAAYQRPKPGVTPHWCKFAFFHERRRFSDKKTDWGFITPVWILMGLVCIIAQVSAIQWAYAALV